jgi:hypothetical protein
MADDAAQREQKEGDDPRVNEEEAGIGITLRNEDHG